jgi:hypothetical protein
LTNQIPFLLSKFSFPLMKLACASNIINTIPDDFSDRWKINLIISRPLIFPHTHPQKKKKPREKNTLQAEL